MEIQSYCSKSSTESSNILTEKINEVIISDYKQEKSENVEIDLSKYKDNKPRRRVIKGSIINE